MANIIRISQYISGPDANTLIHKYAPVEGFYDYMKIYQQNLLIWSKPKKKKKN